MLKSECTIAMSAASSLLQANRGTFCSYKKMAQLIGLPPSTLMKIINGERVRLREVHVDAINAYFFTKLICDPPAEIGRRAIPTIESLVEMHPALKKSNSKALVLLLQEYITDADSINNFLHCKTVTDVYAVRNKLWGR